jgi:hypothetical protein
VHGEFKILQHFYESASLLRWGSMRDLAVLFLHLVGEPAAARCDPVCSRNRILSWNQQVTVRSGRLIPSQRQARTAAETTAGPWHPGYQRRWSGLTGPRPWPSIEFVDRTRSPTPRVTCAGAGIWDYHGQGRQQTQLVARGLEQDRAAVRARMRLIKGRDQGRSDSP